MVSVYWQGKYLASNSAPGLWAVDRRRYWDELRALISSSYLQSHSHLTYWAHVALGDLKWSFNDSDQSVAKHFYQLSYADVLVTKAVIQLLLTRSRVSIIDR